MADQEHHHGQVPQVECESAPSAVETQDRGLFDFIGKKEEEKPKPVEEEVIIATEFEKVHVSEPKEEKKEEEREEKKHGLLEKLHSHSSSSSSSDEEEEGEGGEKKKKKKKGLKEKIKEKISGEEKQPEAEDTTVPVEKYEEPVYAEPAVQPEEKKGFLDKIKEKLPGHKKPEDVPPPPPPAAECHGTEEPQEKKGILEKIKEKLPGYHPKTEEGKEKECASH